MKVGDLVTLKEAWARWGVPSFGIIIDLEAEPVRAGSQDVRVTVKWPNNMQTYESSFGLKVLSEF